MRQGKEAGPSSATSTPNKTPRTPRTPGGRAKRPAPPSMGKSTTSKKIKREVSDAETLAMLNADDLDILANAGNNATTQDQTPSRSRTLNYDPPALDLTQVTSPEDNDDTLTPHEDPAFSFSQVNPQPLSNGSDSFVPYHSSLHAGGGQDYLDHFSKQEYEDDGEV